MGMLDRMRPRALGETTVTRTYGSDSPEFARWMAEGPSASGRSVNEGSLMTVAAAWCCQRIIAESVGAVPWSLYRKQNDGSVEPATDHPLNSVLVHSPNRDMTSVEYRETKHLNLAARGNAYSLVDRSLRGTVTALYPIRSARVTPMQAGTGVNTKLRLADGEVFYRVAGKTGAYEDYPRQQIFHVKLFGWEGLQGLSPLGAARETLGGSLAMEEFANRFFAQGGMPAGTVSYPGWLKPDQREAARETLQRLVGGLGKAHQFALFEGGVKPEPWNTMNLEEMQFLLGRQFSVEEICRFYRVPPHLVGKLDKGASYASVEMMSQEFVVFTLLPYFTRFEAAVNRWLLQPSEWGKVFLRFNFEGLLRAASKERSEFYSQALQNGWMNRNEVRAKENLNRVDGLDGFTAQTNLASVEKIIEGAATAAAMKVQQQFLLEKERKLLP